MPNTFYDFIKKMSFEDNEFTRQGLKHFVYEPLKDKYQKKVAEIDALITALNSDDSLIPLSKDSDRSKAVEELQVQKRLLEAALGDLSSKLTDTGALSPKNQGQFLQQFAKKFPNIQVLAEVLSDAPDKLQQHLPQFTLQILADSTPQEQEQQLRRLHQSNPQLVNLIMQKSIEAYNKKTSPAKQQAYRHLVQSIVFISALSLDRKKGKENLDHMISVIPDVGASDIFDNIADYRSSDGKNFSSIFKSWEPETIDLNYHQTQHALLQKMHFGQAHLKDYVAHYESRLKSDLFWARDIADLTVFDDKDLDDFYVQETMMAEWGARKTGTSSSDPKHNPCIAVWKDVVGSWFRDLEAFNKKMISVRQSPNDFLGDPSIDEALLQQFIKAEKGSSQEAFNRLKEKSLTKNHFPDNDNIFQIIQQMKNQHDIDRLQRPFTINKTKLITALKEKKKGDKGSKECSNEELSVLKKEVEQFFREATEYCIHKVNAQVSVQGTEEGFDFNLVFISPKPVDLFLSGKLQSQLDPVARILENMTDFGSISIMADKNRQQIFQSWSQSCRNLDELKLQLKGLKEKYDEEISVRSKKHKNERAAVPEIHKTHEFDNYIKVIIKTDAILWQAVADTYSIPPPNPQLRDPIQYYKSQIRAKVLAEIDDSARKEIDKNIMISQACGEWLKKIDELEKRKQWEYQNSRFKQNPLFKKLLALKQFQSQLVELNIIDENFSKHLDKLLINPQQVLDTAGIEVAVNDIYQQIAQLDATRAQSLGRLKEKADKIQASYAARQEALRQLNIAIQSVEPASLPSVWSDEYKHHWKVLGLDGSDKSAKRDKFMADMTGELEHFKHLQSSFEQGQCDDDQQSTKYFAVLEQIKQALPSEVDFKTVGFKVKYNARGGEVSVTYIQDGKKNTTSVTLKDWQFPLPYSLVKYSGMDEPLISYGGSRGNLAPFEGLDSLRLGKERGRFGTSARGLGEGQYGFVKYARGLFTNQDFAVKSGLTEDRFTPQDRRSLTKRPITSRPDPLAKQEAGALRLVAEIEQGAPSVYVEDGDKYVIVQPAAEGETYADIGRRAVQGFTKGQEEYHNPLKRVEKGASLIGDARDRVHMAQALVCEMQKFSDPPTSSERGIQTRLAHNDIKPENFLIKRLDNGEYSVRLIDWATYGMTRSATTTEMNYSQLDIFGAAKNCTPLNIAPAKVFGRKEDGTLDITIPTSADPVKAEGADPSMDDYALTTTAFGIVHRKAYLTIVSDRVVEDYQVPGVLTVDETTQKLKVKKDDVVRFNAFFACDESDRLTGEQDGYESDTAVMYLPSTKREGEPFHLYRYLKNIAADTQDDTLKKNIEALLIDVHTAISKGEGLPKSRLNQLLSDADQYIMQAQVLNLEAQHVKNLQEDVDGLIAQRPDNWFIVSADTPAPLARLCLNSTEKQMKKVEEIVDEINRVVLFEQLCGSKPTLPTLLEDCLKQSKTQQFIALIQCLSKHKSKDNLKKYIQEHQLIRLAIQHKDQEALKLLLPEFNPDELKTELVKKECSPQLEWGMDALEYAVMNGDTETLDLLINSLKPKTRELLRPAIMTAAKLGQIQCFNRLIQDLDYQSILAIKEDGWTPYHHLLKFKNSWSELSNKDSLLQDKSFINQPPYPLLIAAANDNAEFVKHFLDQAIKSPDFTAALTAADEDQKTLLNHWLEHRNYDVVDRILTSFNETPIVKQRILKSWLLHPDPMNPLTRFLNDSGVKDEDKYKYLTALLDGAAMTPGDSQSYEKESQTLRTLALAMQKKWIWAQCGQSPVNENLGRILGSHALSNEYKYFLKKHLLDGAEESVKSVIEGILPEAGLTANKELIDDLDFALVRTRMPDLRDIQAGLVRESDLYELVSENELMLNEIEKLKISLSQMTENSERLALVLDEASVRQKLLENRITDQKADYENSLRGLASSDAEAREALEAFYLTEKQRIEEELDQARTLCMQIENKLNDVGAELVVKQREIEKLSRELQQSVRENELLKQNMEEAASFGTKEREWLLSELKDLRDQTQITLKKFRDLVTDFSLGQSNYIELRTKAQRLEGDNQFLLAQVGDLEVQVGALQEELRLTKSSLEAESLAAQQATTKVQQLQGALAAAESESSHLTSEINDSLVLHDRALQALRESHASDKDALIQATQRQHEEVLTSLRESLRVSTEEIHALKEKVHRLGSTLSASQEHIGTVSEVLAALEERNTALLSRATQSEEEVARYRLILEEQVSTIRGSTEKSSALEVELKGYLAENTSLSARMSELERANGVLQAKVGDQDLQIARLSEEITMANRAFAEEQLMSSYLRVSVDGISILLFEAQNTSRTLSLEIARKSEAYAFQLSQLQEGAVSDRAVLRQAHEAECARLDSLLSDSNANLSRIQSRADGLSEQLEVSEGRNRSLLQEMEDLRAQNTVLLDRVGELDEGNRLLLGRHQSEIARLHDASHILDQQLAESRAAKEAFSDQVRDLSRQNEGLQAQVGHLEAEVSRLSSALLAKDATLAEVGAQILAHGIEAIEAQRQLAKERATSRSLTEQILMLGEEQHSERERYTRELATSQERIAALEANGRDVEASLRDLQQTNDGLHREMQALNERHSTLSRRVELEEDAYAQFQAQLASQASEISRLTEKSSDLSAALDASLSENDSLRRQVGDLGRDNEMLSGEVAKLGDEVRRLGEEIVIAREELAREKITSGQLRAVAKPPPPPPPPRAATAGVPFTPPSPLPPPPPPPMPGFGPPTPRPEVSTQTDEPTSPRGPSAEKSTTATRPAKLPVHPSKIPNLLKLIAELSSNGLNEDGTINSVYSEHYYAAKSYLPDLKEEVEQELQALTDEQKKELFRQGKEAKIAFRAQRDNLANLDPETLMKIITHYESPPSIFKHLRLTDEQCLFISDKRVTRAGRGFRAEDLRRRALEVYRLNEDQEDKAQPSIAIKKDDLAFLNEMQTNFTYFLSPEFQCALGHRAKNMLDELLPMMNEVDRLKALYEQAFFLETDEAKKAELQEALNIIDPVYELIHGTEKASDSPIQRVGIKEYLQDAIKLDYALRFKVEGTLSFNVSFEDKDRASNTAVASRVAQCRAEGQAWTVTQNPSMGAQGRESPYILASQLKPTQIREYALTETSKNSKFASFSEERSPSTASSRFTVTQFPEWKAKTTEDKDKLHAQRAEFAMLMVMQAYSKLDPWPTANNPFPIHCNDKTQLKYLATAAYLIQSEHCKAHGQVFDPKSIKIYTTVSDYKKENWLQASGLEKGSWLPWRSKQSFVARFEETEVAGAIQRDIGVKIKAHQEQTQKVSEFKQALKKTVSKPSVPAPSGSSPGNP